MSLRSFHDACTEVKQIPAPVYSAKYLGSEVLPVPDKPSRIMKCEHDRPATNWRMVSMV